MYEWESEFNVDFTEKSIKLHVKNKPNVLRAILFGKILSHLANITLNVKSILHMLISCTKLSFHT